MKRKKTKPPPAAPRLAVESAEEKIARLERELATMQRRIATAEEECEILSKAAAYVARNRD